jgi:hypothetical protein
LGAEIREALGKGVGKPGAEHDNELQGQRSARVCISGKRDFSRRRAAKTRTRAEMRTAMSGLSARTYSCGGEGSRFGRGGVFSLGSRAGFLSTLWKNFRMPWRSSNWMSDSSSEGGSESEETEESSEESSSAILEGVYAGLG